MAFFSKTNVMIKILHNLALFRLKNANFFGKTILENHYIGPRQRKSVKNELVKVAEAFFSRRNTRCNIDALFVTYQCLVGLQKIVKVSTFLVPIKESKKPRPVLK
jgi:hypothetical protein